MSRIGIDIAKNARVAAAVSAAGEVLLSPTPFANDAEGLAGALLEAGCDPAMDIVAMESTGRCWLALWSRLDAAGRRLALINPIQTDAFRNAQTIRKAKTDDIDAVLIAQFARFGNLAPSAVSPEAADGLRRLARYRAHLVEERTALKGRATALADRLFPELAAVLPGGMSSMGFRAVVRELGEPNRFEDAKKAIAFAGIDASRVRSGGFGGTESRMSKRGLPYLRCALMMAADAARRTDPCHIDCCDSMRERGKRRYVALSGVARKLAGTILAVWKEGGPYEKRASVQSRSE